MSARPPSTHSCIAALVIASPATGPGQRRAFLAPARLPPEIVVNPETRLVRKGSGRGFGIAAGPECD
ncbi:hypothetical protein FHW64_004509 [Variovorax sp. Sphag1AA]|nr:hypothetical protein [Variovorax sp. Sphag1AA]